MEDFSEALKAAIADRYELERVLGRGGMATVYLAHDGKHGRSVAVKVLHPELAASVGSERFLHEIQLVAQLNHPHILTLIDSGEAVGFLFFVMPFVEGESLRRRLNREKVMDARHTLPVVQEVADALDYAHRRGVVHRDVKPENILFSEGHAVVTDFGIAKALVSAGGAQLTQSGFPIGTPGYMSPEQAAGRAGLDATTDVFSLACVAYEMLIGETPGMWLPDEAVKLGRFADVPPQHRERLDRLPGGLEQVLVKALALRRELRFASPGDFASAMARGLQGGERFGSTQARAILARAAESDGSKLTDEDEAMSLAGIQRAAAEAGIPPDEVAAAAKALEVGHEGPVPGGVFGVSPQLDLQRFVDAKVTPVDYASLLEEIRVSLGEMGQLNETLGTSLVWSSASKGTGRAAQVFISPAGDKTRIRISDNERTSMTFVLLPLSVGSLVLLGITGAIADGAGASDLVAAIIAGGTSLSVFGVSFLAVRRAFQRQIRRRFERLSHLMARLEAIVLDRGRQPDHPDGE
jgi:hypothetical protein